jgi:Acetyltransferase (GNAT) domain
MNGEGAHVVKQARPTAPLMASNGWSGGRDAAREPVQDNATQSSDNLAPMTLFHENWWLAAVTKGRFEEAVVKNGSQVIGRLPFVIEKKIGFTTVRLPPFTHVLGPVVDAGVGKPQTQLVRRLSIVRNLIDQLPPFDFLKHAFGSSLPDGLAFQDRGFQVSPQYTFEIDCRADPRDLWDAMHFKTRQHIRRAEEKFSVAAVNDPNEFVGFYLRNLAARGLVCRLPLESFPTVFSACEARDSGEILSANWPDGKPAAMVFIVWGHGMMYYLLSTRAKDDSDNGSVSLLIWSAIQRAHDRGVKFDLDGVTTSGIARFLSGFGGRLEARTIVRRSTRAFATMQYAKRKLIGSKGEDTLWFS